MSRTFKIAVFLKLVWKQKKYVAASRGTCDALQLIIH